LKPKLLSKHQERVLELSRKRRTNKFWLSIVQMAIILTVLSLFFTFLINFVQASTLEDKLITKKFEAVGERKVYMEKKGVINSSFFINEEKSEREINKQERLYPSLDLPLEHQEYLYNLCMEYGLNFDMTLAVMEHESKFDVNAIGETEDYGYFQVNVINHEWLSGVVNTTNKPLDPYINMQWGTYMLSWLYDHWKEEGLSGEALDEAVWSSYNKGIKGFERTGHAKEYIEKVKLSLEFIKKS